MGGMKLVIQLEDFIDGKVELLMPYAVKGLELVHATQTSLSLRWKKSQSPDVVMYNIYVDGVLAGGTQSLTHEVTGLTVSTEYVIAVKAVRTSGDESHPARIIVKTVGDYALSVPGKNGNYVQAPEITFDAVELIAELKPKLGTWDNFLIHGMKTAPNYAVTTQHDGLRFIRRGFDETYADDVLYKDANIAPLPLNKKITLRLENKTTPITESLRFFASRAATAVSAFAGTLYRVRFYQRNDVSKLVLVSDYDFTYQAEGKVEDILKKNAPLVIVGADIKFVETNGGA